MDLPVACMERYRKTPHSCSAKHISGRQPEPFGKHNSAQYQRYVNDNRLKYLVKDLVTYIRYLILKFLHEVTRSLP